MFKQLEQRQQQQRGFPSAAASYVTNAAAPTAPSSSSSIFHNGTINLNDYPPVLLSKQRQQLQAEQEDGDDDDYLTTARLVDILDEVEGVLGMEAAALYHINMGQPVDPHLLEPTPIASHQPHLVRVAATETASPSLAQQASILPIQKQEWYHDEDMKDLLNPLLSLDDVSGTNVNNKKRKALEEHVSVAMVAANSSKKKLKTESITSAQQLPPLRPTSSLSASFLQGHQQQQVAIEPRPSLLLDATTAAGAKAISNELTTTTVAANSQVNKFRSYQAEQWMERFNDLIKYKQKYGHCCVPHKCIDYPELSVWVKRQRYQYKLKTRNLHSTLSDERQRMLEDMNFVWDSHTIA